MSSFQFSSFEISNVHCFLISNLQSCLCSILQKSKRSKLQCLQEISVHVAFKNEDDDDPCLGRTRTQWLLSSFSSSTLSLFLSEEGEGRRRNYHLLIRLLRILRCLSPFSIVVSWTISGAIVLTTSASLRH